MKSPGLFFFARVALAVSTASLLGQSVLAETAADTRQANQSQRIDAGISSGQLTQAEQNRLNAQQGRIATGEARAASDGVVTQREERRLNVRQNHASRHIAHAKHDRQRQAR